MKIVLVYPKYYLWFNNFQINMPVVNLEFKEAGIWIKSF
jgi:hypothetical protein